jgi:hypothetical protein
MKAVVVILLFLLGVYWFFDHTAPLFLNHESFGLYNHDIHRLIGVVAVIAAGLVAWKWKPRKK